MLLFQLNISAPQSHREQEMGSFIIDFPVVGKKNRQRPHANDCESVLNNSWCFLHQHPFWQVGRLGGGVERLLKAPLSTFSGKSETNLHTQRQEPMEEICNRAESLEKKPLESEQFKVLLVWRTPQGKAVTSVYFDFGYNGPCSFSKDNAVS